MEGGMEGGRKDGRRNGGRKEGWKEEWMKEEIGYFENASTSLLLANITTNKLLHTHTQTNLSSTLTND